MVFAKTLKALDNLSQQFIEHSIEREYQCLVWGKPPSQGRIENYIGRNPLNEKSIEVSIDNSFGKKAVTHYKTLEYYPKSAFVKCVLETGRTHQIRIHMHHIGHALISDQRYPNQLISIPENILNSTKSILPHQALHAASLGFIHPVKKEKMHFFAPLSPAFQKLKSYLSTLQF